MKDSHKHHMHGDDEEHEVEEHKHVMETHKGEEHKLKEIKIDHKMHEHKTHDHHIHMLQDLKKRFAISSLLTIPILILSPAIQSFLGFKFEFVGSLYILFLLSSFVYFYGGYPFLKGIFNELKKKNPGMMTLIAVAISVAYFYSTTIVFGFKGKFFFWELATLIDIMLLGHYIEMRSVLGASRALEELVKIMPSQAHLIKNGGIVDVSVKMLKVGDNVLIKPGEKIPVDGVVLEGVTTVNEAMLTGESKPVTKKIGDNVIGGSINSEGSIVVKVEKTGKETYLNQVVELVREAQESKSRTQDLANKAAFILTILALTVGLITLMAWLAYGKEFVFAIERAVTVWL